MIEIIVVDTEDGPIHVGKCIYCGTLDPELDPLHSDKCTKTTDPRAMHRLFQARMWREYAQDWDRPGLAREWVEQILRVSRSECLRRAREALRS